MTNHLAMHTTEHNVRFPQIFPLIHWIAKKYHSGKIGLFFLCSKMAGQPRASLIAAWLSHLH